MDFTQSRLFRMHAEPQDIDSLSRAVADLRHTLFNAIQDIAVLTEALKRNHLLDEKLYKELRIERMLGDHSSAGASPWRNCSQYPYTLDEEDFLRERFGATEEEVREYQRSVNHVQTLT